MSLVEYKKQVLSGLKTDLEELYNKFYKAKKKAVDSVIKEQFDDGKSSEDAKNFIEEGLYYNWCVYCT